jgi:diadenosine tetraphosphate (Ap4A) HIT family hydrolase
MTAPSTAPSAIVKDCLACHILAGHVSVPGGTIAENDWWLADHCLGTHGLGAIVVKTRVHRPHLSTLTPEEAAALGPFLQTLTRAMEAGPGGRTYLHQHLDGSAPPPRPFHPATPLWGES